MSVAPSLDVLIVVARYPPAHEVAAEFRARDVAEELVRRGHRVTVLTSRTGRRASREESGGVRIVRALRLVGDRAGILVSGADCRRLRREAQRCRARVVLLTHLKGLTNALVGVRQRGRAVVYDIGSSWFRAAAMPADNWFRRWETRPPTALGRLRQAIARLLASGLARAPVTRPKLPDGPSIFWSRKRWKRHLADGFAVQGASLLEPGVDLRAFRFQPRPMDGETITLLYVGDITRPRGLHCAVLALADLPDRVRLRAVGTFKDEGYIGEVAELGRATGVMARIEISPSVSASAAPALLADADVLVYPIEERERFPRPVLEAFATGTPVVGSSVEGVSDALVDGETGLTFPPGNARELGRQIRRVLDDDTLRARLLERARDVVTHRYALGYTVQQIEAVLLEAVA